jgi:hypothetical protein
MAVSVSRRRNFDEKPSSTMVMDVRAVRMLSSTTIDLERLQEGEESTTQYGITSDGLTCLSSISYQDKGLERLT